MKILNLKFKNINSLIGENQIDFTNPIFTNEGLFAITGKTGAGKSSILDAISLALYGKTPRVEITGNENAVLTRGEKDCYSEIVFEVAGKRWKSSWKQEVTRNGNLKPVNRVIADAQDKIIADQVRTCDSKIIEILGLTFEQFTKVILLAQGSFAAFLQSKPNEKGELLEQITGTEIYCEISKRVFERNKTEEQKLKNITLELGQIKILSEEETKNLSDEITGLKTTKGRIDQELQTIEKSKSWLTELKNLKNQIEATKESLTSLKGIADAAGKTFVESNAHLTDLKEEQEKQIPLFRQVRELDTKIAEKERLLIPIIQKMAEFEKDKKELTKTHDKQKEDLEEFQNSLEEKQTWAKENKVYEELVGNYSVIESQNRIVGQLKVENDGKQKEVNDAENDVQVKVKEMNDAQKSLNEKDRLLNNKSEDLKAKNSELKQILNGKALDGYRKEKENIFNFGSLIRDLMDTEKSLFKNKSSIFNFDKTIKDSIEKETGLKKEISENKKNLENLEKEMELLTETIDLTRTILSLDEHRKNLKDGEPCPLCGATEHPYALGNIPKLGDKEKDLQNLKTEFKKNTKTLQDLILTQTKLGSERKNAFDNKANESKLLSENNSKKDQIISDIHQLHPDFAIPDDTNSIPFLEEIRKQKLNECEQIKNIMKSASVCEASISNLRDKIIPELQDGKRNAESVKNDTEIAQKLANQNLDNLKVLANKAKEKYNQENENLLNQLKKYGVEAIIALGKCLEDWNKNSRETEELNNKIKEIGTNISLNNTNLTNVENQLREQQGEKQNIDSEKQELIRQRKKIFDDKKVEDEENHLNQQIRDAETEKSNAEKDKTEKDREHSNVMAIISKTEKELSDKQTLNLTDKTLDELQSEYDSKKVKLDEYSQKIGAKNQALQANEENLERSGQKIKEKESQQKECEKWGKLNELIGSGDGKKYRNFAQALTFEHLISLANKQLQKMSDRYILIRTGDGTNPFELSVIDKFQNSEERTAQNLSGGEKFIVSLSLALGLANMASKNMPIDTMFIDEGFGTLDSDYLDVALSALSNLQVEGKLIGVISHITELKDRIATHIDVVPSGNGFSKIEIRN